MIRAFSSGTDIIDDCKSLTKKKTFIKFVTAEYMYTIYITQILILALEDLEASETESLPKFHKSEPENGSLSVSTHKSQQVLKHVTRWSYQTPSSQEKTQCEFCSIKIVLFNLALL